ncbi:MAG TPA: phosphate ABC transporter permease family protein, partial [Paracoccaceae bacterium]|nr:phosphate ABC transporter permease family protein [Paracoccaceae bacterium]
MQLLTALLVLVVGFSAYILARAKAMRLANGRLSDLHSRPNYHGLLVLLWVVIVGFGLLTVLSIAGNALVNSMLLSTIQTAVPDMPKIETILVIRDAKAISAGNLASTSDALREAVAAKYTTLNLINIWGTVGISLLGAAVAALVLMQKITVDWRARNRAESLIRRILWACSAIAVLTTIGIVLSLIFETFSFFSKIGWRVDQFLFGTRWSPLSGVQSGQFDPFKVGAVPLFTGTLLITLIAMLVATPIGLFAAIYLSDFASPRVRAWAKPLLEVLAGIPTVVYGFFAAITLAPAIRTAGEA